MRDRIERLIILPFSIGCISEASVAVGETISKKSKPESKLSNEGGESLHGVNTKNSNGFLAVPKPNISPSLHKLMKNFKNLSQLFVFKELEDDDDDDELKMEIGSPTDVKHVAQIGWDGTGTTATATIIKGCSWEDNNINPHELFSSLPHPMTTSLYGSSSYAN